MSRDVCDQYIGDVIMSGSGRLSFENERIDSSRKYTLPSLVYMMIEVYIIMPYHSDI